MSEILSVQDQLMYRGWVVTLTVERIEEEIRELEIEFQGNSEMAESAQYHREDIVHMGDYIYQPNLYLADYQDYENQILKCEVHIRICKEVLEEKRK